MPSFSSLFTHLTGAGFAYERNPRHATYNFSQDGTSLYRNQPRFPFEFYVNINLNSFDTAKAYVDKFFNNPQWQQVQPLVKSIEMPSMKIDTTPLNQYNRKRISQTKIAFEPVKLVFHDVADGKTLKFWEMYYRYYFADGIEAGINEPKTDLTKASRSPFSIETLKAGAKSLIPKLNPNIANLPSSVKSLFSPITQQRIGIQTTDNGDKRSVSNIVSSGLENHNFGFNLPQVQNVRYLIQSIELFQVHGGRFNMVTLVNPRIAAFTHDVLTYAGAAQDRTLELTFSIEYEYAFYNIQNLKLSEGGKSPNNPGREDQFTHGEFLELPALAFNSRIMDFLESNNPLLASDNPILNRIGKNVQSTIGGVTGGFLSKTVHRTSASVLDGVAHINPKPYKVNGTPAPLTRPFKATPGAGSASYKDVSRVGNSPPTG